MASSVANPHALSLGKVDGLVQSLPVAVLLLDENGFLRDANARFLSQSRYELQEVTGRAFRDLFVEPAPLGSHRRRHREPWMHTRSGVLNLVTRHDREVPCLVDVQPVTSQRVRGWLVTAVDVSEQQLAEARLRQLAYVDPLTRLPNRRSLFDELDAARDGQLLVGLILIDIRRFSLVNDTFGHDVGDDLLIRFGNRLRQLVDADDFVARVGGDEFAVACRIEEKGQLVAYAESIRSGLSGIARVKDFPMRLEIRMGLAALPPGATGALELTRAADVALSRAEASAANWCLFEEDMLDAVQQRARIEAELRTALQRGEIVPFFQPIVQLETGTTVGAEVLVRWDHPLEGCLAPDRFMRYAEDSDLIVAIDLAMVSHAATLLERGDIAVPLNVNLSGTTLGSLELRERLSARDEPLASVDPAMIQIEVTESMLIDEGSVAESRVHELAKRGFGIIIDDFGTGYASLNYLQRLPIAGIKIDRHFTVALPSNAKEQLITTALIDLSRALGLALVAEGIETPEQLRTLQRLGCKKGQGYLFSAPLPLPAFRSRIASSEQWACAS